MGPSYNLHILPSCMHTCTGAPLKVALSLRSMPLQYLHLNTGKFKGAWRFCTFCLKLSRPMGTKSHTSKALPASIITKRIGLMVFHWATFRSGCVYLSFPGRFPHVSITHTQKRCQSFAESRVIRLQSALLPSLIPYRRSVNLVFMFHLHTNCSGFVLPHLSVFLFFTRSLFSRSIFVYPCFSTGLTRYGWLKCERSPWLIHQLQIKAFLTLTLFSSYLF